MDFVLTLIVITIGILGIAAGIHEIVRLCKQEVDEEMRLFVIAYGSMLLFAGAMLVTLLII